MNKKILIVSLCATIGIAGSSLAYAKANSKKEKITEKTPTEGTIHIDNTYVKLEEQNYSSRNNVSKNYATIGNECLARLNITSTTFDNPTIEKYKNNMEDRTEVVISDANMMVKLDNESGELLSYIHKNTKYKENTLNEDEVKKIAIELFDTFEDCKNYKLCSLEQFDEELYLAKFFKKYDEYTNPGEMISFGFSPEEKEIVSFTKKSMPFAKNEIKISASEAYNIALPYLEASVATDMTSNLKVVVPNSGALPVLEGDYVYKKASETRLAYVFEFNNPDKTIIYVDATNGEIIGIDFLLGGEF